MSESSRLEQLWAGDFGNAYIERNRAAGEPRGPFWNSILDAVEVRRVLEIGCNIGANLQWIARRVPPAGVYGVDVNTTAIAQVRRTLPAVNSLLVPARDLPFRDGWFDLVFTCGVLIHQPENALPLVMGEMVRCSRRYVLAIEYFAEETVEVPYRGQRGALFKRDYGRLFQELFERLRPMRHGFLPRAEGWDDATYWLFEKS